MNKEMDTKIILVMFWSIAILTFSWFGKIEHPTLAWDFVRWLVGFYIAGNVGDKWATK